ncbi:hypothetical protein ZG05_004389 [Salmonella enterica subsp. enterica]|nr:hypothetical protein [Salmonella enterica subsp. enterica]EDX3519431.1 hypothetical protein [Salmonella enterica subsp. enterica serovar Miami]EHR5219610.1 hypothetical protein [Salmonella enterica]EJC5210325.1 hypothetical protein [Salmonella enterica]
MALAPLNKLNETLDMLTSYIDEGSKLDDFTLKRVVSSISAIPDEPTKLMVLALAYGAAHRHGDAITFFREAVEFRDETVARNYLSYLSHTGQYELYREEAVRLARIIPSLSLCLRARNAAYADGDGELSLFFARKAMAMLGNDSERQSMESDVMEKNQALNTFLRATQLSTNEISVLTRTVANVAKKYNVLAISNDYYTSLDGDAGVVCDVLCDDEDIISDMDIEVATELAMNEVFAVKNVTAWFRGRNRQEVQYTL